MALVFTLSAFSAPKASTPVVSSEDLFRNGAIVELAIELTPENLSKLRQDPRHKVPATVREGSQVYHEVSVHLKGALGSFRGVDEKPGLAMNFQYFAEGQRFHGLRKIMLNNSVQDPSYLHEKLAGELFRAAGVPTQRTSHALVTLNGRKLGLYVLKEGISKDFLGLHFRQTQGNLYDLNQGSYDLGSGADLRKRFRLDEGKEPAPFSDLEALIVACQEPNLDRRWINLQATLDIERFVSFMAMEIITCHVDGYSTYGHNFRLYTDPTARKTVFIPNDLDRMFQECRRSVLNPGFSALAAKALFETPQGRQQYTARAAWLARNAFNLEKLTNVVHEATTNLRPRLAAWEPNLAQQFEERAAEVCERLRRRAESLRKEFEPPPSAPPAVK